MAIFNEKFKLNNEDLGQINGGYILDRGDDLDHSCRYALIDDKTGEWYCMSDKAESVTDHIKARSNSTDIITLDEYKEIFGRDF